MELQGWPMKRGFAGDDHDAPRALLAERRQQRPRQRHDAEEVGFHHAPQLGVGDVLECAAGGDASVMHDGIEEAAGNGERLGDAFGDRSRIRHVELHDVDVPRRARLRQRRFQRPLAIEVAHRGDDAPAARCQLDCGQQSKPCRRSGDEDRTHALSARCRPCLPGAGGSVVRPLSSPIYPLRWTMANTCANPATSGAARAPSSDNEAIETPSNNPSWPRQSEAMLRKAAELSTRAPWARCT